MPGDVAGALEQLFGIGEVCSLKEEQAHPSGVQGDGEDDVGWLFRGSEADPKGVITVVDQDDCAWEPGPHFGNARPGERRDLRRIAADEGV